MNAPEWAPGESPFHARGALYEAAQEFYREQIPGGLPAVLGALAPAERAFFDRRFAARDHYDVLPLPKIGAAAAQLAGLSAEELNRRGARWTAERDLRGVARLVLRLLSPTTLALKLPKLAMGYFDFGAATSALDGAKRCRVTQTGIPALLAEWMLSATEGFSLVGLERTGARAPAFAAQPPRPDGESHGVQTVKLEFELSWR
ncbi:MAG TPA: hypothetical protein VFF06_13950 [Polyangia bacterium]|nr:hypothetical protein [Polyangia bacterium]